MFLYRIWSFEHRAWWAASRMGYTQDVKLLGMYTAEEAADIVENAMGGEVAIIATQDEGRVESRMPDVIVFSATVVATSNDVLTEDS